MFHHARNAYHAFRYIYSYVMIINAKIIDITNQKIILCNNVNQTRDNHFSAEKA